ncbi:MAG: exonuclease domain-containing protein [Oscillospiraceae bacterium]|nr:exonuclease domain-containing protein [Oscillospiraceae bacterium]
MQYIVLDMEWNQPVCRAKMILKPAPLAGEIIQIGAVKLDENFRDVDTLKLTVSPRYYKEMNRQVKRITGIDQQQLASGIPFADAVQRFRAWSGGDFRFITWGFDDIPMLLDNLRLHQMDADWVPECYNLQVMFNRQITGEKRQWALEAAMEKLELPLSLQSHDALNDALYTAQVCRALDMSRGMAEYEETLSTMRNPLSRLTADFEGYHTWDEPLADKRVTVIPCPWCQKPLPCGEWLIQGGGRRTAMAICEEHGSLLVRLKIRRDHEGRVLVRRSLCPADEEKQNSFGEKLLQQKEKKKEARKVPAAV